jgi:hypothetical protein
MAIMDVEQFKGNITGGGARANLFKAEIQYKLGGGDTETTSFLCKGAQLPGSTIGTVVVPFRGRQVKLAGDRTFEPWTITIINDTDFAIRNAFERWLSELNQHKGNTGLQDYTSYQGQMSVKQLDRTGTEVKTYKFVNAWPSIVAPIEVSYDQTDTIEEFQVTIEYDYWTSDTTDGGTS